MGGVASDVIDNEFHSQYQARAERLEGRPACRQRRIDPPVLGGYAAAMTEAHQPGRAVVVVGHGVGRISAVDHEKVVVRLDEGEVIVKPAEAGQLLRAVVDRATAQRLLERLCEPCAEERSLPALRSIRELARAPLEQQVEYLRWHFRKKGASYPNEPAIMLVVAETVLAELAMSLDVEKSDLHAAVKRGKLALERRVRRVLPPSPAVEGCTFVRSFWLGATALVGEHPEQTEDKLTVSVRPGAWHAYFVELSEGEDDDDAGSDEGLLLRHADLATDVPAAAARIELGSVGVEGGTLGVLDEAALDDVEFGIDEVQRTRRDGEGYGDRGLEVSTLGDGAHLIFVDDENGATSILLPF